MKLLKKLWQPDGMPHLEKPKKGNTKLVLSYEDKEVGTLNFNDGEWIFQYSDSFKIQNDLLPIMDFPDKNKVYRADELWPYFAVRIPSIETPYVQKRIKKNRIDSNNILEMLTAFGHKTISSPFLLNKSY